MLPLSYAIDYRGALPKGRLTENGPLNLKYDKMTELTSKSYPARTEKNVVAADATLIFTLGKLSGVSALTMKLTQKHRKPCLHIDLTKQADDEAVDIVGEWLSKIRPYVLNVAGSRESTSKGIYERVFNILRKLLT